MADATAAAVNPGMERYNRYYNSVLAQLQQDAGPERSDSQLKNYLTRMIRPTYEQAIAQRQQQTGQANAAIDTDAASRGMGTSTWVTDAKQRQRNNEAADIASLNSNYNSTLYDSLLGLINQRDQNRLALMNQAQGIAGNMYDRWKAEDDALAKGSGSGGGGGDDGGGGRRGRSGSGDGTDPNYGIETPANVLAHEAAHLVNGNDLTKNGAAKYDMTGFTPKAATTNPTGTLAPKTTTAGSVGVGGSTKKVRQTR